MKMDTQIPRLFVLFLFMLSSCLCAQTVCDHIPSATNWRQYFHHSGQQTVTKGNIQLKPPDRNALWNCRTVLSNSQSLLKLEQMAALRRRGFGYYCRCKLLLFVRVFLQKESDG